MNVDKLMEDILLARKEKLIQRVSQNNLVLVMNENSFIELRTWYQGVMTYPITSLIIDKKEYPLNRLYGMDIKIEDIKEDFKVEVLS